MSHRPPQATQLSSLSTSSTSIHAVNLPQTSSFVSNNINGSNINPRQVAGVISKINVSPPEVAGSNKSNSEKKPAPIYGGNNGSRTSGDGSTFTTTELEREKPGSATDHHSESNLFSESAHSHQLENAALQRLGALLSSSSKSDTSSNIFCEKSDSEISSNLLALDNPQQLTAVAPIATAEESIKSSTEDESTISWQQSAVVASQQGGVRVSNLEPIETRNFSSPMSDSQRNLISSELEAAFCSLDQEIQHQQEVQSGTEI